MLLAPEWILSGSCLFSSCAGVEWLRDWAHLIACFQGNWAGMSLICHSIMNSFPIQEAFKSGSCVCPHRKFFCSNFPKKEISLRSVAFERRLFEEIFFFLATEFAAASAARILGINRSSFKPGKQTPTYPSFYTHKPLPSSTDTRQFLNKIQFKFSSFWKSLCTKWLAQSLVTWKWVKEQQGEEGLEGPSLTFHFEIKNKEHSQYTYKLIVTQFTLEQMC